jgi:hypothetical protein
VHNFILLLYNRGNGWTWTLKKYRNFFFAKGMTVETNKTNA